MESIFDTKEIAKRVEEFFAMYEDTRGSTYDMCEAKIIHSRMVAANCKFIAKSLGFDAYDIDLAWIIGELHDFARFGQIVVTHTFKDTEAFNHAHFGAALLFDHELIDDLIPNYDQVPEEDRKVIKKAVYHHSDFHLPDGLSPREQTYCIVDAFHKHELADYSKRVVEQGYLR